MLKEGRRDFVRNGFLISAGWALMPVVGLVQRVEPYILSNTGSGRATGYAESNKIVTHNGKTHAAWLDSEGDTFWVRIRTFDHSANSWLETVTIGEAYDNHGGPALTIDSRGYLHLIYYPHHLPMRYRRSVLPNDASSWEPEILFGEKCSYPTLVCGDDDILYCTLRRSYDDKPWEVEMWTKEQSDHWSGPHPILEARYDGYSHFQESLAWNPLDQSLHLLCRIHEKTDQESYGRIQSIAYMRSFDFGNSWKTPNGRTLELPVSATDLDPLEEGGLDVGVVLRAGCLAILQHGRPALLYSRQVENEEGVAILALLTAQGTWNKILLNDFLPEQWKGWHMSMPGGLSTNSEGTLFIVAQVHNTPPEESSWGHPSNEIICLETADQGTTFKTYLVSDPDPGVAHWLPSIERQTGHNVIEGRPVMMYTAGGAGSGLKDMLANRVIAKRL